MVQDNRAGMDALLEALEYLDKHVLQVGVVSAPQGRSEGTIRGNVDADTVALDDRKRPNAEGLTLANVGGLHEFGDGVPKRSFIRSTVDLDALMIENEVSAALDNVLDGGDPKTALGKVGDFVAARMKFTIDTSRGIRPLSEARLAQKKAIGTPSTPLINWRLLRNALNWKVIKG